MAKIKAKKSEEISEVKTNKKKIKEPKIRTEEGETLHRFIIILIVIIKKNNGNVAAPDNTTNEVEIDYSIVSVGTILNRNQYNKYYVLVYDSSKTNAMYYSALMTTYNNKKEHEKLFFCDLSNPLNQEYAKEESNPKAQKVEDFAFGEVTLLEIQKGKVTKYLENIEDIEKILQ